MQREFLKKNNIFHARGMGLVEIVIGAAIITTTIVALLSTFTMYTKYAIANQKNIQATILMNEGFEAVRFMRDYSWTVYIAPLTTGTQYYLNFNGSLWVATTTPQTYVDGLFLRTFQLDSVYRDTNEDIAASGTLDINTKKVTVSISYVAGHATTTTSSSAYITKLFVN
jgi:type II secretory pathway pseudopilin PulG